MHPLQNGSVLKLAVLCHACLFCHTSWNNMTGSTLQPWGGDGVEARLFCPCCGGLAPALSVTVSECSPKEVPACSYIKINLDVLVQCLCVSNTYGSWCFNCGRQGWSCTKSIFPYTIYWKRNCCKTDLNNFVQLTVRGSFWLKCSLWILTNFSLSLAQTKLIQDKTWPKEAQFWSR